MESSSANKRPLSAIFLGNSSTSGAPGFLPQLQTQSSLQHSTANGGSGLPSPPATNSTASTGKESLPKRVRKTSIAFATVKSMLTGERRQHDRELERQRRREEEETEELVEDEDHTARLSGPAQSTSSDGSLMLGRSSLGARSTTSSGGMDRVRSLADRNRMVLDKLSSISSAASSRLNSPAPTDRVPLTASTLRSRNVSPMPPLSASSLFPPKSNTSATGSSPRGAHVSLTSPNVRQSRELEPETPSSTSRISPSDSGKGLDQSLRASIVGRQASARDSPRVRDIEFTTEYGESTTPKERERLYEQQRAPPAFTVSGDGSASGMRREGSVRVSFSRSRPEVEVDEFGVSGTSQNRPRTYSSESDDRSITPPADNSRRYADYAATTSAGRQRRVSINEPDSSPTKTREPLRTRAAAGTLGRQRNSSEIIERTVAAARKSPVRTRGALPSEFRSSTESKRASFDNKRMSLDGKRTFSRSSNSPDFARRDSALNRGSPASGGPRAATVRESSRRTHSRWASEDTSVDGDAGGDRSRPRYERRGGSIESPITPGGRSVVGESFKAAGLTKRRDLPEPASATSNRGPDTRESVDWEVEQLRNGIERVGVGDDRIHEEDDDDNDREASITPGNKRVASRTVQNIITSRPGTSNGDYIDDGPRTAPPALRPYRSMNTGLITPSGSGTVRAERGPTPVTPAMLVSAASTEHVRLMLESFAMFESNLARVEGSGTGGGGGAVSELLQNADVVVQASQSLNTLLRESAARSLSAQIEAEVEDRDSREMEIWKVAGAEFRDALKVCDELVRSMTNLLLGVGRVVKEQRGADGDDNTRSSGRMSSSDIRSGRMSAEGLRSGRMSAEGLRSGRMSAEGLRSGRMSAEGLRMRAGDANRFADGNRLVEDVRRGGEVRRSFDGDLWKMSSRESPRDPMRPQTSMSLLRERGRVSPIDTNPVRQSTSRRFFPTQSPAPHGDADTSFGTDSYESPSPASRHMPTNSEHHRERILSIPPSLESVPSESLIHTTAKTQTISRRPRMSVGTVRGAAPFSTPAPGPAPTHLSTATAVGNGSPEKAQRSISFTVSRSGGAATVSAMSGMQAQARKRTISAADPLDPEVASPTEMSDGSATQRLQATITRTRASMDFSADESSASGAERKLRRRTATELFT